MLNPTSAIAGMGLGSSCSTDHRRTFLRCSRGASIGHVSPEAAVGGPIALIEEGDIIAIDIPNMKLDVKVSEEELEARRTKWQPREPKYKRLSCTLCIHGYIRKPRSNLRDTKM